MDALRFDSIARTLAGASSRRTLLGLAWGSLIGVLHLTEGEAKKRHKKKKHHKKHPCVTDCRGKDCGDDGCGGSCGECSDPLTCQAAQCACPDGGDICGGACLPLCPASTPGTVVVRHPATCACCVRPGSIPCPDNVEQCCPEPDSLPCCGPGCDPLEAHPMCQEAPTCHYDVECAIGRRCEDSADPRTCVDIPAG
jgi:hypothetical protein